MAKTLAEIKEAWKKQWPEKVKPYLEAIASVADKCAALSGLDRMACFAEAVAKKKEEMRRSPEKMIEKALAGTK
uniref:Uncharacterized protein n=1 Tax=Ignisphaera aggregans TaxID=334771 RepID=A0A7C5Z4S8_9CREN